MRVVAICAGVCAIACGDLSVALAATVDISVDGTAAGTPLERVWAFHGYDELNYTTTPPGQALLKTLGMIHTTSPHIRTHFLLNTGNGMPSFNSISSPDFRSSSKRPSS